MRVLPTPGSPATGRISSRPHGYWGMVMMIATEAAVFLGLLSAYFFLRASSKEWPQGGILPPELSRISVFTAILLGSSLPMFWAEHAIRRGRVHQLRIALLISFVMGLAFLVNQGIEFSTLPFRASDNAYASLFFVITGLHGLHLLIGLLMSVVVQAKSAAGWFDEGRHLTVTVFGMYWHFVDAVWIVVFSSLYLSEHIR